MGMESSLCGIHIEQADFDWLSEYMMRQEPDALGAAFPSPQSPPTAMPSPTYGCAVAHSSFNKYTMQDPDVVKRPRKAEWTQREDVVILATFRRLGTRWHRIAALLPGRTPDGVRNRWHRLQRQYKLRESVYGRRTLDEFLRSWGIADDWMPPIDLDVGALTEDDEPCSKGADHCLTKWTAEEDAVIHDGVRRLGTKWRQIASSLDGRSDSSVRNRWQRLNGKDAQRTSTSGASEKEEESRRPCPLSPDFQPLRMLAPVAPSQIKRLAAIKRKRSDSVDRTPGAFADPYALNNQTATPKAAAGPCARHYQTEAADAYAHHNQTAAPEAEAGSYARNYQAAVHHALDFDALISGVLAVEIFPDIEGIDSGSFGTFDSDHQTPAPGCDEDAEYISHYTRSACASEPKARRITSDKSSASVSTAMLDAEDEEDKWGGRKKFRATWSAKEDDFISRCVEDPGWLWSKIAEHKEGRSHRAVHNRLLRIHKGQELHAARSQEHGHRCGEATQEHIIVTLPAPHYAGLPCQKHSVTQVEPRSLDFSSMVPQLVFLATRPSMEPPNLYVSVSAEY